MNSTEYELDGAYWHDKITEKPQKFLQRKYHHQNNSDKKSASYVLTLSEDQRKLFEEIQLSTKCSIQQLTIAALLIYFGKTADQSALFLAYPFIKEDRKHSGILLACSAVFFLTKAVFKMTLD